MQNVYVAYHRDSKEIEKSSSGGMFVALSDTIFRKGGVVIGGAYNYITQRLEHIVCRTPKERDLCRGSKYIQSYISKDVYKTVADELNSGIPVLYVGTPCQVQAIKQYVAVLKCNESLLYTCDIVCHGVGSPGIWNKFMKSKDPTKRIHYLSFKDKRNGWKHPLCIAKKGNREVSLRGYSWLYFSDAIMRPACYECDFAKADRVGDFTIGDFWKVDEKCPDMYNPRGTSFLIVNTLKGDMLFETVKESLVFKKVTIEDVIQDNMQHPTIRPNYRDEVMKNFCECSTGHFFRRWERIFFLDKLKKRIFR